ncbi:MAG: hypothetical protein Q8891_11015 [Bacteroidota bacterium]|nr:hypothetical protein [Bacteroidota bacterium]
MKAGHFIELALLFFYPISCAGNTDRVNSASNNIDTTLIVKTSVADTFTTGKVITQVSCLGDATETYALYLPENSNNEALPVIYFFDPHGDGELPLNKYKALADRYHYILIGSNKSKNGNNFTDGDRTWNLLSDDLKARLSINENRLYTCGFSGGAKVATYLALHHPEIKGVIANGAGLPDIMNAGNFNFSYTAIAGEGDMNMTDLVAITSGLDKTKTRHRIIFFDGIHEWAPENTMNIAFEGFNLDAMQENLISRNDTLIHHFITENKKRIADYVNAHQFLKAQEVCKYSISMLDDVSAEVDWFNKKEVFLTGNAIYQKQALAAQNLLQKEQHIKETYQQQFQQGDMNYWTQTIADVKSKAKAPTPEGAMYQRLEAYLSLAFYSISNQLINGQQNKEAQHFVTLYKMVDATNSEAWYFSAILNARNNDSKAATNDLLNAIALGFRDKTRLMQQVEFKNQNAPINLGEIENKIK